MNSSSPATLDDEPGAAPSHPDEGAAPGRLARWLMDDPVRSAAVAIAVLALAVRISVLKDSYFITDDYMLSARAMENPLSWAYLTRVHTGHLEPIGFTVMWLLAHFAPLEWDWAVLVLAAGQVLLAVLVWKLLGELFGRRPLVLVPYAIFSFTPLTMPAFTWLSAAIIWLPLMIGLAGALTWHTRYIRSRRTAAAVAALAWYAVALASFEKSLVFLPFVLVFTLALVPQMPLTPRRIGRLVRGTWIIWAGYAVLLAGYLLIYVPGVRGVGNDSPVTVPNTGTLADFTYLSLFRTFIPGLLGGPWSWQSYSYALAVVNSPRLFDWICWIIALAVFIGSLLLRRGIGRMWVAALVYLVGSLATVAAGRVAYGGAFAALETRYLADAVIPAIVVIGAVMMPLKGEVGAWSPLAVQARQRLSPRIWDITPIVATLVIVGLSLHGIGGYSVHSTANPYRPFVANTKKSIASLPEEAQIYDTLLPGEIIGPLLFEYNTVAKYVSPLLSDKRRSELTNTLYYSNPYVLNSTGALVPMVVTPAATQVPTRQGCRSAVAGSVVVPLTGTVFDWRWTIRIGYLADRPASATIHLGKGEMTVPLEQGLHSLVLPLVGAGDSITVDGIPLDVAFCVGDVQVGQPSPSS